MSTGCTIGRLARAAQGRWSAVLLIALVLCMAFACQGGTTGDPGDASGTAPTSTPTLPAADPQEMLASAASSAETIRSMRFDLTHTEGSIFIDTLSAKIIEANGVWDADQGANFSVAGYIVSGPHADIHDGIFVRLRMVITPDSYYLVDPGTRTWTKQPYSLIPLSIEEMADILSGLISEIQNPEIEGDEKIDGVRAYRIAGHAPASVMQWTTLNTENRPDIQATLWIDAQTMMPMKARMTGAIGQYDAADTSREIIISDINSQLDIDLPQNYVDVSGG